MRRVSAAAIAVLLCPLLAVASAHASGRSVVRDCTDNGRIDGQHSQQDYRDALRRLPSDVDEYTDCRQIIQTARRRDVGSSGSGGGGTGGAVPGAPGSTPPPPGLSTPASPAETRAITQAAAGGVQPVQVAGEPIVPGGSGLAEAALRHSLPGPLLAVLILLGLGALGTAATGARARGLRPPTPLLRMLDRAFPRRA